MAHSRYLAQGERIILQVRRHIAVLARPFLIAAGAVVVAVILGVIISPGTGGDLFDRILGLGAVVLAGRFLWKLWEWWLDRIVITDRRIMEISGVLTRRVASMPLAKLTDLTYRRPPLGRLLGYGHLDVESAGQDQAITSVTYLPSPDDFYRTITFLVTGGLMPRPDPDTVHEASWDDEDTGPLPRVII